MYTIDGESAPRSPDVAAFINLLNGLNEHPTPEARTLFDPNVALTVARAPGRLDVMGGIADYSGSLVLQLPIQEATFAALQRVPTPDLHIVSLGADHDDRTTVFQMPLSDFIADGQPVRYKAAQVYFQRDPAQHWAAYAAGVFLVLMRERNITFEGGVRLLISSSVPEGKGVSSSAALEVAVMQAVAAAFEIDLEPRETALLCQMVENLVVGAPCGVMDQMSSMCGQANRLLALLCQPAELQEPVALPDDIAVWGLDSGVRHSVSGADYGSVRVGAFMGYRIIADTVGFESTGRKMGEPVSISDPAWQGYLANISPAEFEERFAQVLPSYLLGQTFLETYGGTTDSVTQVDPAHTYAVRIPTVHPIYEHFRVRTFAELLNGPPSERRLALLGELMYQSHASYSACGLGSDGTDMLVNLVREAGPTQGLYGAKITGGGSGGTVAVLGKRNAAPAVEVIAKQYAAQQGHQPYIFAGSSAGAAQFGTLRLSP